VIQTRVHLYLLIAVRFGLMLRPTHSRLVTEIDIVPALGRCNLTKEKSFSV
jgi:hypothetical protein